MSEEMKDKVVQDAAVSAGQTDRDSVDTAACSNIKAFKLAISIGKSRKDKKWNNRRTTIGQLEDRLSKTIRTNETIEEFRHMKPDEQGDIKDVGGFVLGTLKDGNRGKDDVISRSAVALDMDNGAEDTLDFVSMCFPYYTIIYSTHKHTPEKPRLRLIIPLSREVTPDEYNAVGRILADKIGLRYFDPTTFEPNRLMYWPSTSSDGVFVFRVIGGELAQPDNILSEVADWRDCMSLPMLPEERDGAGKRRGKRVEFPLDKRGIVGDFCAAYPIRDAIEIFLSDVYEPTDDPNRYKYIPADSTGGLIIHDDTMTVTSHHATDPLNGQGSPNAFDMVRIHLYGNLDAKAKDVAPSKMPSYKAMVEMVRNDERYKETHLERKREQAAEQLGYGVDEEEDPAQYYTSDQPTGTPGASADDGENGQNDCGENDDSGPPTPPDRSWIKKLEYDVYGKLKNTIPNLMIILKNDPRLANIRYNMLANTLEICGDVPWEHPSRFWRDADDAQLIAYIEVCYGSFSERNYRTALTKTADDRSFHPVLDFLDSLPPWDGVERVDTLLVDCLGADDTPYTRAATRKTLVAAVSRVKDPGCKYDTMTVLVGPQGCGKSTLVSRLAGPWFNDGLQLSDTKDKTAAEKLQGTWIMEIGELAGMKKTDVEVLKGFLSRQNDIFREAYGRRTTQHPRQCIFIGTTNAENGFLRDTTGNRRFWPVVTPGFDAGSTKDAAAREARGAKPSWKLTKEEINQIWAETLVYFNRGEELILPRELNAAAVIQQKESMETDDREAMVVEYLEKLLPENWDTLSIFQRRDFISGGQFDGGKLQGTVQRTRVCNMEIWCECFGRDRGSIGRQDSNAIIAMMERIHGWKRAKGKQRVPGYGVVAVYERDE